MLLSCASLLRLPLSGGHLIASRITPDLLCGLPAPAINVFAQRWKYRARKPIGSPRSRKKRYYVKPSTPIDPEEFKELIWREPQHVTKFNAIAKYLAQWKAEHYPEKQPTEQGQNASEIDDQFKKALAENEAENARVAVLREARYKELLAWWENERQRTFDEFQLSSAEETAVREEQVRQKKEIVANMVTPENLDERIAAALDNPVTFDYAIDLKGRRFEGRPDPLRNINMPYPKRKDRIIEEEEQAFQNSSSATASASSS